MPRSWSNVKYTETRSAAQKAKSKPSSLTLFVLLIVVNLVVFWGLVVYTMDIVMHHPVTEIPGASGPAPRG